MLRDVTETDKKHPEPDGFGDRWRRDVRTDSDEIRDWLNGTGRLVFGGIAVFVGLYAIYALVLAG